MKSDKLFTPIAPISKGKMIINWNGSALAWSSGQLGISKDGKFNQPEEGETAVVAQARQVLNNLKALAEDNGFNLERDCVKNVVYLKDMNDFAKVNEVYKEFFKENYPARTCIAVAEIPLNGLVEIESIFYRPPQK